MAVQPIFAKTKGERFMTLFDGTLHDGEEKRFVVTFREGRAVPFTQILTDKVTGVQYLVHCPMSGAAAMSVLVDQEGKPLLGKTE